MKCIAFFIPLSISLYAAVERDYLLSQVQERLNNHVFIHKIEKINGTKKEFFFIDGIPCDGQEYQKQIIEAEQEELKTKRKHFYESRIAFHELQYKARVKLSQEEFRPQVQALQDLLGKLNDPRIKRYIRFSTATIHAQEELDRMSMQLIPQAKLLIEAPCSSFDHEAFQKISGEIAKVLPLVQELYCTTIDYAITTCSDTCLLKELFAFID